MGATEIVAAARRVLTAVSYGFLTTWAGGSPSVRMVQHLNVDEDLRVVFGTGRSTRKTAEVRANPAAVYAAADLATGSAVSLYGEATINDDLDHRRAAWLEELRPFFPDGPGGSEFVLMSVNPDRVEMWSAQDQVHPDPFGLNSALVRRLNNGWAKPGSTHPAT